MAKLFLVEDHALMRKSLRKLLQREQDFFIFDEATTAEEALKKLESTNIKPDLVLVDASLPGMCGLDLMTKIQARWPELPCVMLSGYHEAVYKELALTAGAMAYINKESVLDIVPTIRSIQGSERIEPL